MSEGGGIFARGLTATVRCLALALLCAAPAVAQQRDSVVRIIFMDVGQGDAALIVSPTGRRVLIDAGPVGARVASRLRRLGIDTLDLVVASHNHADHIGGMVDVLGSIVVRRYIDNGMPQPTQTYRRIVDALDEGRVEVLRASPRTISIGGGAELRILPSSSRGRSQNDRTVGVALVYGQFSALFTGDAEEVQRGYWMESASLRQTQLLKVSHHGSSNGTDDRWLRLLEPCAAVVSVGRSNGFGHPSPRVLGRLSESGARVYRTDLMGDVAAVASSTGAVTIGTTRSARGQSGAPARVCGAGGAAAIARRLR